MPSGMASFYETVVNLAAGAFYRSAVLDCRIYGAISHRAASQLVDAWVFMTQAGNLRLQVSRDSLFATARTFSTTAIVASTVAVVSGIRIPGRFFRFELENTGAIATTTLEFQGFVRLAS